MSLSHWRVFPLVALLLAWPGSARADSVVVESYGGARPDDADQLLGPVLSELESRGFLAGAALASKLDERHSRQATVLGFDRINEGKRFIDSGRTMYLNGNFDSAQKELAHGLEIFDAAPVTLARRQELRDTRFDGLLYLALTEKRRGDAAKATRAMAELIRSFPDREVSRAKYSPDAWELFRAVGRDLAQQGLGTIAVVVDDPRTGVFVNERYVGGGSQTVRELPPGRYRVYVQQGQLAGRVRSVDVQPGTEATVNIAWATDNALETSDTAAWLAFESDDQRAELEGAESLRLARALGARGAVLLGLREVDGQRSIYGIYMTVDSTKPVRTGVLAAEPVTPSADKLRNLARFLAGDESLADQFQVASPEPAVHRQPAVSAGPRPFKTWKWVTLVGGVAAVGAGVALIAIHEPEMKDGMLNPDSRNSRPAGIATSIAGAALLGVSTYFWIKDSGHASRERRAALLPVRGGAVLSLGGTF